MPFSIASLGGGSKRAERTTPDFGFVGFSKNGIIPEHRTDDIIISWITRYGEPPISSVPTPAGWTSITEPQDEDAFEAYYGKMIGIKATNNTTITTAQWISEEVYFAVYRGFTNFGNATMTISLAGTQGYPEISTLQINNGTSWVFGFGQDTIAGVPGPGPVLAPNGCVSRFSSYTGVAASLTENFWDTNSGILQNIGTLNQWLARTVRRGDGFLTSNLDYTLCCELIL